MGVMRDDLVDFLRDLRRVDLIDIFIFQTLADLLAGLRLHREHVFLDLLFLGDDRVGQFEHLVHGQGRQRNGDAAVGLIVMHRLEAFVGLDDV